MKPGPTLRGKTLVEVDICQPQPVDLVVFDVTESVSNINVLFKRSGNSLADVVHGSGPCVAWPFVKPVRASAKLAHVGP